MGQTAVIQNCAGKKPSVPWSDISIRLYRGAGGTEMITLEFLRNSWFLIVFIGGLIYWGARQDMSIGKVTQLETRITSLENRTTVLETGIGQIQIKIDDIKEDLNLIKGAVIK